MVNGKWIYGNKLERMYIELFELTTNKLIEMVANRLKPGVLVVAELTYFPMVAAIHRHDGLFWNVHNAADIVNDLNRSAGPRPQIPID